MSRKSRSIPASSEYQRKVLDSVGVWASYYRANPHRYAIEQLHIHLKLFQMILLYMMNVSVTFVLIACRGRYIAKGFGG